ncbi:alcohol dehydrogenase [Rhodococcus sp. OK611]|uniref:alcohol dehydrogenase catalytic domain-containing protein n=1 Tax=unclassified Rhodococcus (in: high G+C Gram-positive bacteria) TaxID=192944 RepID=UPI000BC96C3A|nr:MULTISPECIES: alcohol dehydrogenase catalytic domain-containing protein [unclassified Rhodococcus (in: high G+C Gram-positive bacteria)]PTR38958.1 alcohol dehydrogenase [Rhodococcus sp. OK611]SNX92744.1 alcohol dehydrogenase [Rhodococcus sp. OK270]
MSTIRTVQVDHPNAELRLTTREIPDPGPGQVRVTVEACGICHSDDAFVTNALPGVTFPVTPGHEIAGRIDAVGDAVARWRPGDRVAVGWFGGACLYCDPCRDGDFMHCENLQIPGWHYPGGYADAVVVPATAIARIPDEFTAADAGPMACAGVTTYNSLRRSSARPGDLVAILGLGGLGHLGVQFAAKMGFDTVAIARGPDKEPLATQLGARHYIDSTTQDVAAELRRLGGARVVQATAANSAAMAATIDGLSADGELIVIGAVPDPIPVSPLQLIFQSRSVHGHPAGTARDVERTLDFAALTGIRPMIEEVPLTEAPAAYRHALSGKARFRVVLTTGL